jgi:hypothetical protein
MVQRIWLTSPKNQVPFCVVDWDGPGIYAGTQTGDTFRVFRLQGKAAARLSRVAVYMGYFGNLSALLKDLQERGAYEVVEEAAEQPVAFFLARPESSSAPEKPARGSPGFDSPAHRQERGTR